MKVESVMANRLISRQKFIPGGFLFYIPPLKWKAPRNLSFDNVVQSAIHVLKGNPAIAAKLGWDLSYNAMSDRVDEFNAKVCEANGWTDYISRGSGPPLPKLMPHEQVKLFQSLRSAAERARQLVSGAKSLMEWVDSHEAPVPSEQSQARAAICAVCPMNEAGDFTKWFTVPAAELVKRQVQKAQGLNLKTSEDDKLNLCTACSCPLKLKVHVPILWIAKGLTPEIIAKLQQGKNCWILSETAAP